MSPPPGILPKSHKLREEWAELEVKDHLELWYGGGGCLPQRVSRGNRRDSLGQIVLVYPMTALFARQFRGF